MKIKLIFFIFIIFIAGFIFWKNLNTPKDFSDTKIKIFQIKKGEGAIKIAENLEKEGLIKSRLLFLLFTFLKNQTKNLKAGIYYLSPSMTIPEIMEKIVKGEVASQKITIIEGWSKKEIGEYLEKLNLIKKEDFENAIKKDYSQEFDFLKDKPRGADLEGYLFPDTYEIKLGESAEEIVKKMLKNFGDKLTPDLQKEIKKQNKKIFEILILASLLEKEVKTKEDKELVAGILWKRLENKMPLQVDATITYITGKKTTKISIEETQIDNPYNTYKYLGLPPGPICNPGLESILAAIYPKESDYWYYLSAPDGKTIFSKTLQEHNIAKAKYLK
jgi:UPF0755 protein